MDILVNVVNQKLRIATNLQNLVSGSQEFIRFVFNLSEDWDDLHPFAQFQQKGVAYNRSLDLENDNSVYLPQEIKAGACKLTLYGSGNGRIGTTNYVTLLFDENIIMYDAIPGDIPEEFAERIANIESSLVNLSDSISEKYTLPDSGIPYNDLSDTIKQMIEEAGEGGDTIIIEGDSSTVYGFVSQDDYDTFVTNHPNTLKENDYVWIRGGDYASQTYTLSVVTINNQNIQLNEVFKINDALTANVSYNNFSYSVDKTLSQIIAGLNSGKNVLLRTEYGAVLNPTYYDASGIYFTTLVDSNNMFYIRTYNITNNGILVNTTNLSEGVGFKKVRFIGNESDGYELDSENSDYAYIAEVNNAFRDGISDIRADVPGGILSCVYSDVNTAIFSGICRNIEGEDTLSPNITYLVWPVIGEITVSKFPVSEFSRIEQVIQEAIDPFVITITNNNGTYNSDKTLSEIRSAISANQRISFVAPDGKYGWLSEIDSLSVSFKVIRSYGNASVLDTYTISSANIIYRTESMSGSSNAQIVNLDTISQSNASIILAVVNAAYNEDIPIIANDKDAGLQASLVSVGQSQAVFNAYDNSNNRIIVYTLTSSGVDTSYISLSGAFVVSISNIGGTLTADQTYNDIQTALTAGNTVYAKTPRGVAQCYGDPDDDGFIFVVDRVDSSTPSFVVYIIDDNNTVSTGTKQLIEKNESLGNGYVVCSTAASTTAKTASLTDYDLVVGGSISVKFTNAVPSNATLSINGKTAKAIHYQGAPITADIIQAGDTATFRYNGTYYHLIAIDRQQSGGGSASNAVLYTSQSLTTAQQEQARTNIGAGTYSKPGTGIPKTDLADDAKPFDVTIVWGSSGGSSAFYITPSFSYIYDAIEDGRILNVTIDGQGGWLGYYDSLSIVFGYIDTSSTQPVLYTFSVDTSDNIVPGSMTLGDAVCPIVFDVSGSTPSFSAQDNYIYECGECSSLTVTGSPLSSEFVIIFTSGSTPTTLTLPQTISNRMPSGFQVEANTRYEISVRNGWPLVASWEISV